VSYPGLLYLGQVLSLHHPGDILHQRGHQLLIDLLHLLDLIDDAQGHHLCEVGLDGEVNVPGGTPHDLHERPILSGLEQKVEVYLRPEGHEPIKAGIEHLADMGVKVTADDGAQPLLHPPVASAEGSY